MKKEEIGKNVSRAIKEGKWLDIKYINSNNISTQFWIAITDINVNNKTIYVSMFNHVKAMNIKKSWIWYDKIIYASVIEFTSYERPYELITLIENNRESMNWLFYGHYSSDLLNYYLKCKILDNDPFQKDFICVEGIDLDRLQATSRLQLNDKQAKTIIEKVYKQYNNIFKKNLIINRLSIDINNNKKYIICYYLLTFDPHRKSLILEPKINFNSSFMIEGRPQSLFNFISMDIDEFTRSFEGNEEEFTELIRESLGPGDFINTKPDIMILEREIPINLMSSFLEIEERYYKNTLNPPLQSFFGGMVEAPSVEIGDNEPVLIFQDSSINLSQIRVMYNSLKHHVTYVHGPPGTGKTKTIINVILSALFNDKTVLVSSSNNKPIDNIKKQLYFEYNGNKYSLPFLRLGNNTEVENAINEIIKYFRRDHRNLKNRY